LPWRCSAGSSEKNNNKSTAAGASMTTKQQAANKITNGRYGRCFGLGDTHGITGWISLQIEYLKDIIVVGLNTYEVLF